MKVLLNSMLIIGVLLTGLNCSFGKRLVYSTADTAFYTLDRRDFSDTSLLSSPFRHPYQISPDKLIDILGNLKFKKRSNIGELKDYVFAQEELRNIARDLSQTLENIKEREGIFLISKFDETKSVLSQANRTSVLFWVDADGLNAVFGEIHWSLHKDISSNFYDWTIVEPAELNSLADENSIDEDESFSFHKVKGYYNRKWLV
ncbi:MAG: hypothetical protein K8R21_03520, partial [Leptospira sp.]|nr:hypothetical protein [Leptospira sp.]